MEEEFWLYYKIYLEKEKNGDIFIKICLPKILRILGDQKLYTKWFFIRYFDSTGYHIRLRFKILKKEYVKISKIIEELLSEYYHEEGYQKDIATTKRILPINSVADNYGCNYKVEKDLYEVEDEKYGKNDTLKICEYIFQDSSDYVIKHLENKDTISNRYSLSLQMTKSYLESIYKTKQEKIDFLIYYTKYWLGYGFYDETIINNSYKSLNSAAKKRINQTSTILIKNSCNQNNMEQMIYKKVSLLKKSSYFDSIQKDICFNLIHMNNNRLGIWTTEESYIAQLILTCFFQ